MQINLCSIGDPNDPKTWSGTPYNIYTRLLNDGNCNLAFSSLLSPLTEKMISIVSKMYYLGSTNHERAFIQRYFRAIRVGRKVPGNTPTLHLGTLDLPFLWYPKKGNHYLFCDFTWDLYCNNPISLKKLSKRVVKSAENLERKSYKQVKHIFSISESVKENLISHYKIPSEKITVVGTGLGVIKPYFGEKNYQNHKILFAAKGLFKDKGGDLVIKAFEIVRKQIPDAELTIVEQNEYTSAIKIPHVKSYGFIPSGELQSIFNTNSLFVMPAVNEPWGLVYLEAMACKMPIIGLNRNSFPEISGYGRYGFGLDEINSGKLAGLIIKLLINPVLLKDIGQKAQKYCLSKFTWENVVSKIVKTIEDIEK